MVKHTQAICRVFDHFVGLALNGFSKRLLLAIWAFSAWCPLKGHTYLNMLKATGLFKYAWPFSDHQALKGYW